MSNQTVQMFSEGVLADHQPDPTSDRREGVQTFRLRVSFLAPRDIKGSHVGQITNTHLISRYFRAVIFLICTG